MNYCPNCGTKLEAHMAFCTGCGIKTGKAIPPAHSSGVKRVSKIPREIFAFFTRRGQFTYIFAFQYLATFG